MIEHTPGPWEWRGDYSVATVPDTDGSFIRIADIMQPIRLPQFDSLGQWNANARLIAAAPELLAACEAVATYLESFDPVIDEDEAIWEQLKAAIAKAKRG